MDTTSDVSHNDARKKKLVLVALFCVVILAAGWLTQRWIQSRAGTSKCPGGTKCGGLNVAEVNSKGTTWLTIKPNTTSLTKGQAIRVDVVIEGEGVQAAAVSLTYDPKVLAISDIKNGNVFAQIVSQKIEAGSVMVITDVGGQSRAASKTGTVFSFIVTGVAPGLAELTFDPKTTKTALRGGNTLKNLQSASIVVQ